MGKPWISHASHALPHALNNRNRYAFQTKLHAHALVCSLSPMTSIEKHAL